MRPEVRRALEGSILKWERIVLGKGVDRGIDDCPLCKLFYQYRDCEGCPVKERAGGGYCLYTPYQLWVAAWLADQEYVLGDPHERLMESPCVIGPATMEAAILEHDFLCSLLPED